MQRLTQLVEQISLADSAARRNTIKNLADVNGSLANFAAELAATNCYAKETVLVTPSPSAFVSAAAAANSIEIFERPPTASDLVALAAGDLLSPIEYQFARILTGKDFVSLLGFTSVDDQSWETELSKLRDLYKLTKAQTVSDLIIEFEPEPIIDLAIQVATTIARRTPVIIDGTKALLAASIVFEFSVAARSWLFVADLPKATAGQLLFKHRNWIQLSANQVAAGDGLAGIAAISLARTAALLLPR